MPAANENERWFHAVSGRSQQARVVVVGAGNTGVLHAACWAAVPSATIVGIVDTNEATGKTLAERHDASFECVLGGALEGADVVSICSPTYLHLDHVLAAAAAGADILLEKPAAATPEDVGRMQTAVQKAGVRLSLRAGRPFCPELRQAKSWVAEGRVGEVRVISDVFCSDADVLPSWYFDRESSGGGILLAAGVHGLEQLLWLKDACRIEPLQTETRAVSGRGDNEDFARTYLYLNDTACHAEYSWKAGTRRHWTTTLYGNRGTVRIAPYGYARLVTAEGTEEAVFHPESAGYAERVGACTLSTMESLLAERTVPHRRHPTQSDLASHRRSLELVRALYSMTSTDTAR